MTFIRYIVDPSQLVLMIGTVVGALVAFIVAGHYDRYSLRIRIFTLVAGGLILVGTVWSGYNQSQDQTTILNLNKTNAVLNAELARRSMDQARYLSGGDNYCYFDLVREYDPTNHISWYVIHTGPDRNTPVYGVHGTIMDYNKEMSIRRSNQQMSDREVREATAESFSLGDVNPTEIEFRRFRRQDMGTSTSQAYVIDFYARNGHWRQATMLERVNGKWLLASKVRQVGIGPLSMKCQYAAMSKGFPTNALPSDW